MSFVSAALRSVPGVRDFSYTLYGRDGGAGARREAEGYPAADPAPSPYVIALATSKRSYGSAVFELSDREAFQAYEPAVHNFTNSVAMRLENIEYQTRLEEQVATQTAELELNRTFLESIIDNSRDSVTVVDADFNIVRANPAAVAISERAGATAAADIVGRKCFAVFYGRSEPCDLCPTRAVQEHHRGMNAVIPYPNPDKPERWYDVSSSPVFDVDGTLLYTIEIARDVTKMKELEEQLRRALADRELLLREIHHRVKNNLNMVISLLRLQFGGYADPGIRGAVEATVERVQSMSLVHQFLYQSDTQSSIDFHGFVERVIEKLSGSYSTGGTVMGDNVMGGGTPGTGVRIVSDIGDVEVGIDAAVPVSLIVTELVMNAVKYAFPDGRAGTIRVSTAEVPPDRIRLLVEDDGVGLPADFDMSRASSLGMQLVQGLTEQIHGELEILRENGTAFSIVFPRD